MAVPKLGIHYRLESCDYQAIFWFSQAKLRSKGQSGNMMNIFLCEEKLREIMASFVSLSGKHHFLDKPAFCVVSKPLLTESGIYH